MKPLVCLLIDDDPDEHEFFLLALSHSYDCSHCWCAHSAQEATEQIKTGSVKHPDYIFLDWNMGHHDGASAIKLLRQERVLETTPIFIVSLLPPLLNDAERGRLGIRKIIQKQGSIQEFGAALSGAIEYQ